MAVALGSDYLVACRRCMKLIGKCDQMRACGRSAWNALSAGLVIALAAGLGQAGWRGSGAAVVEQRAELGVLGFGLRYGTDIARGQAVVRHEVLCWQLWRYGRTPKPWRYVAYLNVMTKRLLLDQSVGRTGSSTIYSNSMWPVG